MPWVRFDDSAPDNPKLDALSDGAFRLWFNAICYSNRNLTDGFVPTNRVPRLTPHYKPQHQTELVNAGAWHKQEDGITIHGYLDYQPSSEQINQQREYERQKKARQRANGTANVARSSNGKYAPRVEDDAQREAERRYQTRAAGGAPVIDPQAWIDTAARRLREEGFAAPVAAQPVRCSTCKDVELAEPCPDCT